MKNPTWKIELKKIDPIFNRFEMLRKFQGIHNFQDEFNLNSSWNDTWQEYIPGGDMRGLLNNVDSFPEKDAKFYLAEMILAVVELHKEGKFQVEFKLNSSWNWLR